MQAGSEEWADDLLARWRSRKDVESLGQLLKWQRDRAYATARRILGNDADAEDAVQQSFVKMLSRTQGFDSVNSFKLAIYRAVVQCAVDMARANKVRSRLEKAMSTLNENNQTPTPAENAEALKLVWEELAALPEESRALVVLCYQEGLSVSDAAEILSEPRETLRDRLNNCLNELRSKLVRRGVTLSLVLLVGLLQHGRVDAAPAGLCEALDHSLPGPSCSSVPPEVMSPLHPERLLSNSLAPAKSLVLPVKIAFGAAAAIGIALLISMSPSPARKPATVASAATKQTVIQSPVPPRNSAVVLPAIPATPTPQKQAPAAEPLVEERASKKNKKNKPHDVAIALENVPELIKAAGSRQLPGIRWTKAELEDKPPGSYELEGELNGKLFEFLISADGVVLSFKEDRDDDDKKNSKPQKAVPPPEAPVDF